MLHELEVDCCNKVVWSTPTDSQLPKSMTDLSNFSEYGNWLRQAFQKVENLKIVACDEFIDMWQKEICLEKPPQGLHTLAALKKLCIEDCQSLVSLPEACFLSTLSELEIVNCNFLTSLPERMKGNNTRLEFLRIEGCDSLTFVIRGLVPSALKKLDTRNCKNLQCLWDDKEDSCTPPDSSSATHKTSTSLLQYLFISECLSLTCLSSRGQLPEALQHLEIKRCPKLESIAERFPTNILLGFMVVRNCESLKYIPERLQNLNRLHQIGIFDCPALVSLGKEGIPNTNLFIQARDCEKLEASPNNLHSLKNPAHFEMRICPRITSFPRDRFPTNLESLSLANLKIFKPLLEWGLHKLICLTNLRIGGSPVINAVAFPQKEMGMILPTSLRSLGIYNMSKLKYLSSKGFQNLTSLKYLFIFCWPNLISFPETGLLSSVLKLYIYRCPAVRNRCKSNKGQECSKISHIPCIEIVEKFS